MILIPRMKDGAEVLGQRDQNQGKLRQKAVDKVNALRRELTKLSENKSNAS